MIKPVTLDSSATVVWMDDPAIDVLKSDLEGYASNVIQEPGSWSRFLKFKDGQQPTKFVIGVVPPGELVRIEDECQIGTEHVASNKLRWLCFLNGLRDIEHWQGQVSKRDVGGVSYVDPVWVLDNFARHLKQAAMFVGGVIWAWNNLPESDAKN